MSGNHKEEVVVEGLSVRVTHAAGFGSKTTQLLTEKYCCFVYIEKPKSLVENNG